MALCISAAIAAGCKDDSLDDYFDYLDSLENESGSTESGRNDIARLSLNELDGNAKFIELYNGNDAELNISGVQLRKDDAKIIYEAPAGTVIAPHGFMVLSGNATDFTEGFTSGLSADKAVMIQMLDPDGNEIDVFKNLPSDPAGAWNDPGTYSCKPGKGSFSRFPDGTGKWYVGESTPLTANSQGNIEIKW